MHNRKRWHSALFMVMVAITWAGNTRFVSADPGYGMSHHEHHCHEHGMLMHHGCIGDHLHHLLKHRKDLGLTDEQVTKLKAIGLEADLARIKGQADIHIAERELAALLEDEKTDLSAIEAKVKESEMREVSVRMAAYKARHAALAVLTPEQRDKAKMLHERMMGEMMRGQTAGTH